MQSIKLLEWEMITGAKLKLQKEINKFPQASEVEVVSEVVSGYPSEVILEQAAAKGIDLIATASLGRSGIARYLICSVARNFLKGVKCPVLMTK